MTYRPPKKPTLALETDIVQDNIPAEVYPKIYIGSIHAAFNQEALSSLGVTHILNASRLPSTFPKSFIYLSIDIRDKDESNILACIPAANIFIEAGIENGGVMVHCYGGRSRSAALIAAFLMSSCGCSYQTALQRIQTVRSVAHINKGFEIQLKAYAHANYDVYIAQQVLLQGRVRALQSYRAIEGDSADDLIVKASERKKFGSMHPIGSNGSSSRRPHHGTDSHQPGSKRSLGSAKDEDDSLSSSSEDAEEEDNLMECAVKPYHGNTTCDSREHHSSHSRTPSSHTPRNPSSDRGISVHYIAAQDTPNHASENSHHTNPFRLRQQIPLMDPRSPRVRLSRPGSTSVCVIPPLRGLERVFCCAWCQSQLFNLASVIRTDVHVHPLPDIDANLWAQNKSDHLDSYTSHSVLPLSPREVKQNHQEKESSYLMPAPSPRGSGVTFGNPSYPDDAKITSLPLSTNRSFGNGFKSPPKTMRSKAAKSFDFDVSSDAPRNSPRTNLFAVSENDQSKLLHHDSTDKLRVTSPMEISDDKPHPFHDIKQEYSANHVDEKPPLCEPPSSSRRHSHLQLSDGDETHPPSLSRPGSNYRSRAPSGISSHSLAQQHVVSDNTESPRISFPHGSRDSFSYPSPRNRPQSAEKRRWLARVKLLKTGIHHDNDDSSDNFAQSTHDEKVAKLSHDDDEAIKLGFGRDKYIYLEYLEWMGEDLLSPSIDSGELKCNHCHSIIGSWTWKPSSGQTLNGLLQPPVIRVHKNVIHEVDIPLDPTPASTPRVDDHMEDGHTNS